ncbi:hypothetical protein [Streptomyces sp. NPDC006463]|uniref:hypothetical protein n=1 Tax=Streptomyces sp. NPDC006463 TaxID=3364746 RepID=UPI0036B762E4
MARLGAEVTVQSQRVGELTEPVKLLGGTLQVLDQGRAEIRGVTRFQSGDLAAERGIPLPWRTTTCR